METLSFTFGILSTIAVITLSVIVFGIVKVLKQQTQIFNLEQTIVEDRREFNQRFSEAYTYVSQNIETIYRDMNRNLEETRKDLTSYTDARIDKLGSKFKTEKQLLKEY
jgi:CHASE1-domain containing sensor protein